MSDDQSVDHIKALVVGFERWERLDPKSLFGLLDQELRLAKAGALYADEVTLAGQVASMSHGILRLLSRLPKDKGFEQAYEEIFGELDEREEKLVLDLIDGLGREGLQAVEPSGSGLVLFRWMRGDIPSSYLPLTQAKTVEGTKPEVFQANYLAYVRSSAGKTYLETTEQLGQKASSSQREMIAKWIEEIRAIRSGRSEGAGFDFKSPKPSPEGQIALGVLGGLPAFPDADWDVIYDIRDRLKPARINFRAAISKAAEELKDSDIEEVERACSSLKRQTIAPALIEIEASLEEMGAVPTLMRTTQSVPAVGAAFANLALAAGDPAGLGLSALAHGLASAPAFAAGIRELSFRRKEKKALTVKPYWLLHELKSLGGK